MEKKIVDEEYFIPSTEEPHIYRFFPSHVTDGLQGLLEIDACRRFLHPSLHAPSGMGIIEKSMNQEKNTNQEESGIVIRFSLPSYTFCCRMNSMSMKKKTEILGAIGYALLALHDHGYYHGQVEEKNIVFSADGVPLLTSWSHMGIGDGMKKDVRDFLALVSRVLCVPPVQYEGPLKEVMNLPLFSLIPCISMKEKFVTYPTDRYPGIFRDILKMVVHWHRKIPFSTTKSLFLSCDILYRVGHHLHDEGPNSNIHVKFAWGVAATWIGIKFHQRDNIISVPSLLEIVSEQNTMGIRDLDILQGEMNIISALGGCIWRSHLYSACRNRGQLKDAFGEFILTINKYILLTPETLIQWTETHPLAGNTEEKEVLTSSFF